MSQLVYRIDLTKIDGEGDFPCPRCGVNISPEDETNDIYSVMETRSGDESLEEVVITCNRCQSIIHLMGFQLLELP